MSGSDVSDNSVQMLLLLVSLYSHLSLPFLPYYLSFSLYYSPFPRVCRHYLLAFISFLSPHLSPPLPFAAD